MAGTGTAYPVDAVSGYPQFTALQGRGAFAAAMAGATAARSLGGITGVRPGTPANTVTATSTTWTAAPFGGYIDMQASATNGGYFFQFGATTSGAVTAAGGSARTDIVWVQINDSNTSDGSTGAPRVVIDYTANTTTPPARAFVIAQINVPASGGGTPTVTWLAPMTVAAGGMLPVSAVANLAALGITATPGSSFWDLTASAQVAYTGTRFLTTGEYLISPASIAVDRGSSANTPTGAISVNSVNTLNINGIFSPLFDYYRVVANVRAVSASTNFNARLRSAGVDDGTAANYGFQIETYSGSTSSVATASNPGTFQASAAATNRTAFVMELFDPGNAVPTIIQIESRNVTSVTSLSRTVVSGVHAPATAYDGLTLYASGGQTFTGTVKIYGGTNG